jgi:hypothetical protein
VYRYNSRKAKGEGKTQTLGNAFLTQKRKLVLRLVEESKFLNSEGN